MIKLFHNLLNDFTADEFLGDFHSYTIMNNAIMYSLIHDAILQVYTYIPRL